MKDHRSESKRSRPPQDAESGRSQRSQHLQKDRNVFDGAECRAANRFQSRKQRVLLWPARRLVAVDKTDIFNQPRIAVGDPDDGNGVTGCPREPANFLQQPCAERVELADAGHVNLKTFRPLQLGRNDIEESFKSRGVTSRPGAARGKLKRVAMSRLAQKGYGTQSTCR